MLDEPISEVKQTSFNGDHKYGGLFTPISALLDYFVPQEKLVSNTADLSKNAIRPDCECSVCELSWQPTQRQKNTDKHEGDARRTQTHSKGEAYSKANYMSTDSSPSDAKFNITQPVEQTQEMEDALRPVLEWHGNVIHHVRSSNQQKRRTIIFQGCSTLYPYSRPTRCDESEHRRGRFLVVLADFLEPFQSLALPRICSPSA
jgi:hypothetical protein